MKLIPVIGLRGRLTLLLLAVFASLGGALAWHVDEHRGERVEAASEALLANTRLIAARQQAVAAHAEAILTSLALSPLVRPGAATAECSKALAARLEAETEFINIAMALPDGDLACSAVPPGSGKTANFADRAWFRQALKSEKLVIGDTLTGRVVHMRVFPFAKAMRDDSNRVSGVLFMGLDLAWLRRNLAKSKLMESAHLIVMDGKGRIAAHYHPSEDRTRGTIEHALPSWKPPPGEGEAVVEVINRDGTRTLYGFAPLFDTVSGIAYLWLGLPLETVTGPANRETLIAFAVMLTALLLAMAATAWGGERFLVRPFGTLAQAARRFGAGDFTTRTALPHTDGEIGGLAQAFDEMAETIAGNEKRFRLAAEASLDAQIILTSVRGEDGEILDFAFDYINSRAEEMLGMAREKVMGQKLCEMFPVNRTGGFFDKYAAVVETGVPLEEEFPIDTPEVKAKVLRHQVVRIGDGIAISARDITAWKEMAEGQRLLARRNKDILRAVGEGILGLNLEGRITFANPSSAAMLQRTEEELLGLKVHDLLYQSRAGGTPYPEEECPVCTAYRDGVTERGEDDTFRKKDGSNFPVEYVSTAIRDRKGELAGAVVAFNDITEQVAKKRALARIDRALRTLSKVNLVLVRATDETTLLDAICRIIVEEGEYRMAWVGFAEDDPERTITPKAWAGIEDGRLAKLDLTWADTERGQEPAGRAIRSGNPQIIPDILADPAIAIRHELAVELGYAACFTFPLIIDGKVIGMIGVYAEEAGTFNAEEVEMLTELANDLTFGIASLRVKAERNRTAYQHAHHAEILQNSLEQSIQAIADTVEARDPYTAGHQRRVGELAEAIAREMALPEDKIHGIRLAAIVHDLGKIQIPAEILSKPGKLTDVEFMLIKTHPTAGHDILKDVKFPWPIADIVWQHHEKLDGSGYPRGLKDGQILIESRIMTVADVVEAMSSHRPYRPTLGTETALKEIEQGRGSIYDSKVVDACLKLFGEGKFTFQS